MKRAIYPSQEWLKSRFSYLDGHLVNRDTEELVSEYGPTSTNKYLSTLIGTNNLCIHRLIYILHHGEVAENLDIDHIDRNPLNNRIENLRACSRPLNSCNAKARPNCKSGVRGISMRPSGKFSVMVCGKYLGQFSTLEEASKYREDYISQHVQ